jgi:hypothetical protein
MEGAMSFALAIKRSYRYFIPSELRNPRKLVRQIWLPAFAYIMGLSSGMVTHSSAVEINRVTSWTIAALLVLYVLRFWAGKPEAMELSA